MEIPKVKNKYREMYFYSAPLASYSTTASAQRLTTTHQFLGVSGWTLFSWSMSPSLGILSRDRLKADFLFVPVQR